MDTDVVVLAVSTFGVGKQYRCISVHGIVKALGDRKSLEFYMSSMPSPAVIKPLHSAVVVKVLPGQHGWHMKRRLRLHKFE